MAESQGVSLGPGKRWSGAQIAGMVNMEINQVMAVMRQNARWAVAPRYLEEELGEDPLLRDFKILRRKLFTWQDWASVKPTDYLTPFLEVIRSEETSAPITGVALSAVHKVLSYEVFDEKTTGAAEVMHFIVDAVTGCKFEVTDPASEEVVLLKILQVLLACLKCRVGPLLTNTDVINIVNTCLRVAFTKGELLQRTSCQMMQEMVRTIFARLREFEPAADGPPQDAAATSSGQPEGRPLESVPSGAFADGILSTVSTPRSIHSAASTPRSRGAIRSIADIRLNAHVAGADGAEDGPGLTPKALKAFEEGKTLVDVVQEETSAVKLDPTLGADSLGPAESATVSEAIIAAGTEIADGIKSAVAVVGGAVSTAPVVAGVPDDGTAPTISPPSESRADDESATGDMPPLPPPVRVRSEPKMRSSEAGVPATAAEGPETSATTAVVENGDASQTAMGPTVVVQSSPYGLPCLVEVFRFLCTLIVPEDGADKQSLQHDSEDLSIFGLALLSAAIEVAGGSIEKHPRILALVTDDLFRNLMQTGQSSNLLVLSLVSGIVLSLYQHLKQHLKLQMAAFFEFVVLRAAQGKFYGATYEQQEAALEILQDFCRQPSFMADMYANADCDITCSNTFEDLSNLLSKNAFPVNGPLSALHLLSLEGLLAVIQCMADRADNANGPAGDAASTTSSDYNLEEFPQFWNLKCDNWDDPAVWVEFLRRRKYVKRRLMIGADHFNRDPKKGLEFLQGVRLLPEKLDPESVAFFFRMTPGLNKNLLGEYFGEPDAFNISVLECFTKQFNFTGMALDGALRTYLEAFRLPGEAQKISRVLEAFASHYYEQCPQNFAHKDAAYVLSYSVIMLNTDQHNGQVKRKMTEEEFVRNNRKINDGKDLPREMLTHLYHSIAKNEIRMSSESIAAEPGMTYSRWLDLLRRAESTTPFLSCDPTRPLLDRDMFSVIWGPSIAAISVVFDHADDADTLQQCMDGFLAVAKMSAAHQMEDVFDNLVVSLCKFTTLINEKPATAFGENNKARMATSAVFKIANRHGDTMRSGWRNILDCVIRLHKLGLLPTRQNPQQRASDGQDGSSILANAAAAAAAGTQAGVGRRRSAGIFNTVSRQFQNLLSIDSSTDGERSSIAEHQLAAQQRTLAIVEACHIDDLFTDSKFLHEASLLQLVKALINVSGKPHQKNVSTDEEDTALFCLDLLIAVTLRNRDRILLLWPAVHEHLASIVSAAQSPSPLVEKAVLDLLRVCQRLLPYKEDLGDELLKSLQLVLRLDARVADAYAERITREMLTLVKSSVTYIRSPVLWKTVCSLLAAYARHPEAAEPGFEALTFIMQDAQHVTPVNFLPCMDAALAFAEGRVGGVERSCKSLDLLASLSTNVGDWARTLNGGQSDTATSASISSAPALDAAREALDHTLASETASTSSADVPQSPKLTSEREALIDLWLRLSVGLGRICLDPREDVRNNALGCLQRSLLQGEALDVRSGKVWVRVFDQIVFPTLDELLELAHKGSSKAYRGMEGTLRRAMVLLSRVFLQFLTQLASNPGFANLWVAVLNRADGYLRSGSQRAASGISMAENIPELLKNMLLVMAARGILVPDATPPAEGKAPTLWALTWQHPIFRSLDPHFREELFPPPKPAPVKPTVDETAVQEKPAEAGPTAPTEDAEKSGQKVADEIAAGVSMAVEGTGGGQVIPELVKEKGLLEDGSMAPVVETSKAEDVDIAEGYEKVEKEMVEPFKTAGT